MEIAARYDQADRLFQKKRLLSWGLPGLVLAYLTYVVFAFHILTPDMFGLPSNVSDRDKLRFDVEHAQILVSDMWSYKVHITRDNRSGDLTAAVEGERKGTYPPGETPDWVLARGETTEIDLGEGHVVTYLPDNAMTYEVPGFGTIRGRIEGRDVVTNLDEGDLPGWISLSKTRLAITTDAGRVNMTRNKTEVFNYFPGWELFWFTLDSPYYGHGIFDILFGDRIDPARGNIAGAWHDFWQNNMWRHADVAWALFETVLMAFLGTVGAAIVALPLAFMAAKNFTPILPLRFGLRRVFDFLRGVDGLIWTILLSRAFGPGPLTGSLAILFTDTGSFGKMFSEALENVDQKQIDGVASTGAKPLQRYRFGVIPQITPVLLSQVLYFLESNTRSATIIGAITGGGIGLLLTQAMITQKDWEEVAYYIILVIVVVMLMDSLSGWLRRKLIKGE